MVRLSDRLEGLSSSLTLDILARANTLKKKGIDIVNFAAGEPDFPTPPLIRQATVTALEEGFTRYTPATGIPELKEAIVKKFKQDNQISYEASQIVVSCGAKHSLFNLLQVLCNDGDEVLFGSPYWVSYPEFVRLAGGKPVPVPTEASQSFRLTRNVIERFLTKKTKVLILNSPANPTGSVYEKEELEAIAHLAVSKDLFVISDEIYEKLIFDGLVHYTPAALCPDLKSRVIVVNGFSKVYAMTGWRLGYLAAEKEIAQMVSTLQSHSTSNPTSFAQQAAQAALEGPQNEVAERGRVFEKRRNLICQELDKIPQLSYVRPHGAFYVFCGIEKTGLDSIRLSDKLLDEARVAVVPGIVFGDDQAIRLSFALSEKEIVEGIQRIGQWLNKK